jgi:hypothetical protein
MTFSFELDFAFEFYVAICLGLDGLAMQRMESRATLFGH